MGRTPLRALKRRVSSESFAVPDAQPLIDFLPPMSCSGVTVREWKSAPMIIRVPLGASPSTSADIDLESGAVARYQVCPTDFLQRRRGCAVIGIDVLVSAQFGRKGLLVSAATDRDRAKTDAACILNSEMSQAADALDGDEIAAARS